MPRQSPQALMIDESGLAAEILRPDPPADLTDDEAVEWCRIVDSMPPDHFIQANLPMLVQLCRHIIATRQLSCYMQMFRTSKDLEHVRLYLELAKTQLTQTEVIHRLSRSMRLTQQSTYIAYEVNLKKASKKNRAAPTARAAKQLEMEDAW